MYVLRIEASDQIKELFAVDVQRRRPFARLGIVSGLLPGPDSKCFEPSAAPEEKKELLKARASLPAAEAQSMVMGSYGERHGRASKDMAAIC